MGIIVSSFPGCGKHYLMNTHGDKVKMLNAGQELMHTGEPTTDEFGYDYNLFVDAVMKVVDDYDIVFIPTGKEFLDVFNKRNIDYDLFYPSKDRRKEFLENFVRKRVPSRDIMMLDRDFDKEIDRLDSIESENCYKHQMPELGHFIGNDGAIMQYVNNVKQNPTKNDIQGEGVEESSRSEEDNEEDKS